MRTPLSRAAQFASALVLSIGLLAACTPRDSGGGGSAGDRRVVDAPIDAIEILIRESSPPGYTAHIESGLPSGCARFDEAKITGRSGNTITVKVTNTFPADENVACTAIYGTHETNLDLGQDFVSGQTYTVKVNDQEKTFVAQ